MSSTEGDDVVNKHPMMFRDCTIGVINKVDLAPLWGRISIAWNRISAGTPDARVQDKPEIRGWNRSSA